MERKSIRIDFHQGTLRVWGMPARMVEVLRPSVELVWDPREPCHRCDAMAARDLYRCLAERRDLRVQWEIAPTSAGRKPVDEASDDACGLSTADPRHLAIPDRRNLQLRPDQTAAVEAFRGGGDRGIVVMPTGTGKTVVAIELMLRLQSSVLIIAPVRDLMYQWHAKILEATGVDAGLIGDGVHRVSPISVTTYDSATIHMPRIGNRYRFLIFDEVHHLSGVWRSDAARMATAPFRLGLTATLPPASDRSALLTHLVGPVVYEQSIADAAGETLAPYSVRRIAVQLEAAEEMRYKAASKVIQEFVYEQRQLDPSFQWAGIHKLVAMADREPERAAAASVAIAEARVKRKIEEQAKGKMRVLEDLFRLHAGEGVLVFTGSNVMARAISLRFLVPCLLSHCAKRERQDLLAGFAEGRYPVLVANRVLDEGVDLPAVKVAVVIGGLSSQRQAVQRLGRVLRRDRDREAILYEVVTDETKEVERSRERRRNRAYRKTHAEESGC